MRQNWSIDEGYFVCTKVEGIPITFLIDTGSNVSILSKGLVDQFPPEFHKEIQPTKTKLLSVTGEVTPFLGKTTVTVEIGSQRVQQNVLIASIENDGILGMDFLTTHHCDLMLTQLCMKLNGEKIRCFPNSREAQPTCCRVAISEYVEIPPETEVVVQGFVTGTIDRKKTGIVEVDTKFLHKKGLLVAKALVCPSDGTVPIRIANPYDEKCQINKHTVVATYEPLDLDPPESSTYEKVSHTEAQANSDNTCTDTEIPDHLKALYEKSSQNLSPEEKESFKQLLIKYQDTFSSSSHDLGRTTLVEHHINLMPGTKPIKQPPYRLPLAKRKEAEREIQMMADKDLIEPSTSPFSSPAIIVPKKDGGIRFCIDYRRLNKVTIPDSQPLPHIGDCLDALGGSKWFSTLDLKAGFHQVGVAEEDRPKTAFCIPGSGLWQFKVMPFGAINSPAVFERLMEKIFAGMTYSSLLIYLDDIIVYGKTFEVHLKHLEEVLQRLKDANLKLNSKKCVFFQKEVSFLGHLISEDGVKTSPEKVKSIQEWPTPTNISELRSFIGLCSYLRRFIPEFSKICKPLHTLTEKGRKFEWTEKCEAAFKALKQALISAPVLAFPDENGGEFILDADASNVALGSVLSQVQEDQEKVIAYYSKCFSRTERKYCTTRKELLAIVSSVKHFHTYLYGRHFTVRSDHGSLRWLMNFSILEGQTARFIEFLSTYDFHVEHRSGVIHRNADAMSRRPCSDSNCKYCEKIERRNEANDTGLINREDGSTVESSSVTEPEKKDGMLRCCSTEMDALVPSSIENGKSQGSVNVHLDRPSFVTEKPDSCNNNIPQLFHARQDGQISFDEKTCAQTIYLSEEQFMESDVGCKQSIVDNVSDLETDDEEELVVSYFSHCGALDDYVTSQNEGESESLGTRSTEVIDIDRLTPENISTEQDNDSVVGLIKTWKAQNQKPTWDTIAPAGTELKAYWRQWESLYLVNNVLYRKWENNDRPGEIVHQIVLPTSLRRKVFLLLHAATTAGHLGQQKTVSKIRQRFYWYHCRDEIEYWCRICDVCSSRKQPHRKAKAPLKQYNVGYPLERIALDLMGPLPSTSSSKHRYILLVCDYFTKWLVAVPLVTIDAKTVAGKLIDRFISVLGVPSELHSDQGSNFESCVFREVCELLGIHKTRTTPGRPQSDGMVERTCRSIQAMLSSYVSQNQKDWDVYLPLLVLAYNSSLHDTTKCTPSKMMLGRELRLPIDLALGIPEERISQCESDYAYQLERQLVQTHDFARKHMQISSDGMKRHYDRSSHFIEYAVGDLVWFHNPVRKAGISLKLQRHWKGPYVVTQKLSDILYRIQESPRGKSRLVHYDRLKMYKGEKELTWFQKSE